MAVTVFVQRSYLDGKLHRTTKPAPIETLRKWLDNLEKHWTKNGLMPLTTEGMDFNNCHSCERISPDELVIVNTAGKRLRFVNVERKG